MPKLRRFAPRSVQSLSLEFLLQWARHLKKACSADILVFLATTANLFKGQGAGATSAEPKPRLVVLQNSGSSRMLQYVLQLYENRMNGNKIVSARTTGTYC
jgi:hypothetical protein